MRNSFSLTVINVSMFLHTHTHLLYTQPETTIGLHKYIRHMHIYSKIKSWRRVGRLTVTNYMLTKVVQNSTMAITASLHIFIFYAGYSGLGFFCLFFLFRFQQLMCYWSKTWRGCYYTDKYCSERDLWGHNSSQFKSLWIRNDPGKKETCSCSVTNLFVLVEYMQAFTHAESYSRMHQTISNGEEERWAQKGIFFWSTVLIICD